jgi:hypothetical protein
MKKTHYLKTTFVPFFLSLSLLPVFFAFMELDGQDPWLSDLHPPRLTLLTPPALRIFPTPLSPTPFIENKTTEPEMPSLQEPPPDLTPVSQEEPALSNVEVELQKTLEGLHFHETEGVYFGQHAPRLKSLLRISGKKKIQKQVEKAAVEIGVDPRLAKAMAAVESGYDQRAVSPQGAIGVLQLMPRFFCRDSEITPEMLFDPDVNIRVGLTHFKSLLDKFNENVDLSLAAYNAGAQRVIDAGHTIPPFEQTQNYIRKVKKAMGKADLDWSSMNKS